ncbi:MAG: transposase [Synechococcus sp. SB0678_bin_12]|nr:transposase [Synechococcus sp. SB0678_bin_12]
MSIPQFYKRFPTAEACAAFIEEQRWGDQVVCPTVAAPTFTG